MTVRLYADHKQIPLLRTQVRLHHLKIYAADCAECETRGDKIDQIDRAITFEGGLTAEPRAPDRNRL
jgi:putative redox protein